MIPDNEQRALQLAKRVFEHFTKDALLIARDILAMEKEFGNIQENETSISLVPMPIVVKERIDSGHPFYPLDDVPREEPNEFQSLKSVEAITSHEPDLPF